MKIYDCFLLFNELDLLEIRLNILRHHVDYFVIVESSITFQGNAKKFFFEENRARFSEFSDQIIYYKISDHPRNFCNLKRITNPNSIDDMVLNQIYQHIDDCPHFDKKIEYWWGNDFYQRECIWRALALAGAQHDDFVMVSDVDEIPNPKTIHGLLKRVDKKPLFCLRQHEFCYYLNYYHNSDWIGTCGFIYGDYSTASLNSMRFSTKRNEGLDSITVEDGGWHFTSIGGVEAIKTKIKSWGHKEFNTSRTLQQVEYNVKHGFDIFRRPGFGRLASISSDSKFLPDFLVENSQKLKHLFGESISSEIFYLRLYRYANLTLRSLVISLRRWSSKSRKQLL